VKVITGGPSTPLNRGEGVPPVASGRVVAAAVGPIDCPAEAGETTVVDERRGGADVVEGRRRLVDGGRGRPIARRTGFRAVVRRGAAVARGERSECSANVGVGHGDRWARSRA
jgi:hypothetical protein